MAQTTEHSIRILTMRCPFCHQNIRIQGRFCPRCGEQIFGLPVGRPGSQPGAPGPTAPEAPRPVPGPPRPVTPPTASGPAPPPDSIDLDIDFGAEEPAAAPGGSDAGAHVADDEYIGKICPYCRFPIKAAEEIVVCPQCEVPHHLDCWRENEGCTTYGCTGGTPAAQPLTHGGPLPSQTPSGYGSQSPPLTPDAQRRVEATFAQMQAHELNARATNALVLSVLGILCFLPAMIGFFMGIAVLSKAVQNRALANHPAKTRAIAAIVIALFWLFLWGYAMLSGVGGG